MQAAGRPRRAPRTFSSPAAPAAVSEMTDIGLHRPDRQVRAVGEHARHAARLAPHPPLASRWRGTPTSDTDSGEDARRRVRQPHRFSLLAIRRRRRAARAARPSLDRPMARITPRIETPAVTASDSRISATTAAPSLGTSPSAARWNGRDCPVGLAAPAQKPPWTSGRSGQLTPPAIIRSAVPSCSRSQPSLIAYRAEAQAASSAKAPAPRLERAGREVGRRALNRTGRARPGGLALATPRLSAMPARRIPPGPPTGTTGCRARGPRLAATPPHCQPPAAPGGPHAAPTGKAGPAA